MTREVNLLADTHDSEKAAKNYQRFAEVAQPDIVMIEATYGGDEDLTKEFHEYRTMADIHEAFGADISEEKYQAPEVAEAPLYSLAPEKFQSMVQPIQKYVEKHYDGEMEDVPDSQKKALHIVRDVAKSYKDDRSSLKLRLSDAAGFLDADIAGIEKNSDRSDMFEYGAREIEDLPDNLSEVNRVFDKISEGGTAEAQSVRMEGQLSGKDYLQGCQDLIEEYRPVRDRKMAETVKDQISEEDHESAVVAVGRSHIEGIQSELPENWEINILDMDGEPSEWEFGESS